MERKGGVDRSEVGEWESGKDFDTERNDDDRETDESENTFFRVLIFAES
jgi:hypothetical protein